MVTAARRRIPGTRWPVTSRRPTAMYVQPIPMSTAPQTPTKCSVSRKSTSGTTVPSITWGTACHASVRRRGISKCGISRRVDMERSAHSRWRICDRAVRASGPPHTLRRMRWIVHGERTLYSSPWVGLRLADVEIPGGERFDHHVVRVPREAAGCVVHDPERGVLLLWRHRFITDTWGRALQAGATDVGPCHAHSAGHGVPE